MPFQRFEPSFPAVRKKPAPEQVLAIRYPTCGAAPGEKCELSTGHLRTSPHSDRRWIAADKNEKGEDVAIKQGAQVDLAIDADQKDTIKKEK
jgi:hypothetical protein